MAQRELEGFGLRALRLSERHLVERSYATGASSHSRCGSTRDCGASNLLCNGAGSNVDERDHAACAAVSAIASDTGAESVPSGTAVTAGSIEAVG